MDYEDEVHDTMLQNYSKIEKIGQGSFGRVFKAVDKRTGKLVALKQIMSAMFSDESLAGDIIRELSLLRELNHPNIIQIEEVIFEEGDIHFVFEYLYTDLAKYLKALPADIYMERWLQKSYQYQILQGICYCHQRAILHRDLKPQNLLLNTEGAIKIADFGLSRVFAIPLSACTRIVQTPLYRAPEVELNVSRYTPAIDMWSIGCIFAEMATKNPLISSNPSLGILHGIFKLLSLPTEEDWKGVSQLPLYSQLISPEYGKDRLDETLCDYMDPMGIAIVRLLLQYDPAKRVSAKRLLKHPYYSDVDRSKIPASDYDGTLQLR